MTEMNLSLPISQLARKEEDEITPNGTKFV